MPRSIVTTLFGVTLLGIVNCGSTASSSGGGTGAGNDATASASRSRHVEAPFSVRHRIFLAQSPKTCTDAHEARLEIARVRPASVS